MSLHVLASLGWDAARTAEFAPLESYAVPARVTRVDRGSADVATGDNPLRVRTDPRDPPLAVGDWVALCAEGREWRIERLLERRSLIRRVAAGRVSTAQPLVANVDLGLVVVPVVPDPRLGMVERLVALTWDAGVTPVIVLTKADLVPDPSGVARDVAAAAPGADVAVVSTHGPLGLSALHSHLGPGRTCCLLGRSGAGKSTLVNTFLGEDRFVTQDIRGKGRHTTTSRELVVLPYGAGVLVDTPGLRGVGLWIDGAGIEQGFTDVETLTAACRFADCGHVSEPGCAVLAAVDAGELPERRLESWRKLQREAAWVARRRDARLRTQEARRWKAVTKEMRRSRRSRS